MIDFTESIAALAALAALPAPRAFNTAVPRCATVVTKSFFNLVFDKGRDVVFREIIEAFNVEYRKYKQIEIVKITTAEPISDALKTVITKQLQDHPNLLGKTVTMESKVDPNIIGGFVVEMNNELYDASIRHDLQLIKKQFVENMYVSKIIAS